MKNLFRNVGSQLGSECCLAFVACTTSAGDPLQKALVIATADGDAQSMFWCFPAVQNKIGEGLGWCMKELRETNHAPVVGIHGVLTRGVRPFEMATLAAEISDPDGDKLTWNWWQCLDADAVETAVSLQPANSDTALFSGRKLEASATDDSFIVLHDPGEQVQIILEVADNGTPSLAGYHRVICGVQGN